MDANKDYYATLGALPSAEDIVIRAAYKALAQRYHPDRFEGPKDEALRRMQEINEAYEILADPALRKEYDKQRGSTTQSGDSYFGDDANDAPPHYDPLEKDWAFAVKYYPDLQEIEGLLSKIAWRLGYSFKAYMLAEKAFEKRVQIANAMERNFLESYFGTNAALIAFAKELIQLGHKAALKSLNQAVQILGNSADPNRVISQIKSEIRQATDAVEMRHFGITFDGAKYRWENFLYDKLADAIDYAKTTAKARKNGFMGT
jgi:hypothetical protein